jgi:2-hydroxychromene-2-carboxylate isomerase
MENVDFYYSMGSRYSYLASTQMPKLIQETGCHIEWHPINSVRLMVQREVSPFEGKPVSGQYEWAYRELDAKRWANFYGVSYFEPRGRVQFNSELLALACTAAKHFGKVEDYSNLLFTAMFQTSIPIAIDESKCLICAEKCGISTAEFHDVLISEQNQKQLDDTIHRAIRAGIFGVPTFVASGELFWGNDRIVLLRHYLSTQ